MKKWYDDIKNN